MTRKQVMNAPRVLSAAEQLLFAMDVSERYGNRLAVNNAMQELRAAVEASREPLKIDEGMEIPFPKKIYANENREPALRSL
jgi:hypothetical protein